MLTMEEIERLEDIEDIHLYDEGKAAETPPVSADKVFKSIESEREKK